MKAIEQLFEEMIEQQLDKVLRIANSIRPGMTRDDVMQPHDFKDLGGDPIFNLEDGILAGLRAAQAAMRQRIYPTLGGPTLARPPQFPGGFPMPPEKG